MNIELNIEAIQLNGFRSEDQAAIRQALSAELTRLFSERGIPASLQREGSTPNLNQPDFNVAPSAEPSSVGVQLAHSIYGGF